VTRATLGLTKKRTKANFDPHSEIEALRLRPCRDCGNSGVIRRSTEYPNLEDARCCLNCPAGETLAGRLAHIAATARLDAPARAA